jgi:hypothetical protein
LFVYVMHTLRLKLVPYQSAYSTQVHHKYKHMDLLYLPSPPHAMQQRGLHSVRPHRRKTWSRCYWPWHQIARKKMKRSMSKRSTSKVHRKRIHTCRGKVAENMTLCLSDRVLMMMRSICGSKPISNMRSASSSTRYVTRRRFVIFPADGPHIVQ